MVVLALVVVVVVVGGGAVGGGGASTTPTDAADREEEAAAAAANEDRPTDGPPAALPPFASVPPLPAMAVGRPKSWGDLPPLPRWHPSALPYDDDDDDGDADSLRRAIREDGGRRSTPAGRSFMVVVVGFVRAFMGRVRGT